MRITPQVDYSLLLFVVGSVVEHADDGDMTTTSMMMTKTTDQCLFAVVAYSFSAYVSLPTRQLNFDGRSQLYQPM